MSESISFNPEISFPKAASEDAVTGGDPNAATWEEIEGRIAAMPLDRTTVIPQTLLDYPPFGGDLPMQNTDHDSGPSVEL